MGQMKQMNETNAAVIVVTGLPHSGKSTFIQHPPKDFRQLLARLNVPPESRYIHIDAGLYWRASVTSPLWDDEDPLAKYAIIKSIRDSLFRHAQSNVNHALLHSTFPPVIYLESDAIGEDDIYPLWKYLYILNLYMSSNAQDNIVASLNGRSITIEEYLADRTQLDVPAIREAVVQRQYRRIYHIHVWVAASPEECERRINAHLAQIKADIEKKENYVKSTPMDMNNAAKVIATRERITLLQYRQRYLQWQLDRLSELVAEMKRRVEQNMPPHYCADMETIQRTITAHLRKARVRESQIPTMLQRIISSISPCPIYREYLSTTNGEFILTNEGRQWQL